MPRAPGEAEARAELEVARRAAGPEQQKLMWEQKPTCVMPHSTFNAPEKLPGSPKRT